MVLMAVRAVMDGMAWSVLLALQAKVAKMAKMVERVEMVLTAHLVSTVLMA
jgi:hypothetical protein